MPTNNSIFIPADPQNISLRPLTKGMFTDIASNAIPVGGFVDLNNIHLTLKGLKRRPGWNNYLNGTQLSTNDQPAIDIAPFWLKTGTQVAVLLTNRYLYTMSATALTGHYWEYTTGTVSNTGATVTGAGTDFEDATEFIQSGDWIVLDTGSANESVEISSISNGTTLVLATTPSTDYSGVNYSIRKAFSIDNDYLLDCTIAATSGTPKLIIADGTRPVYTFDGSTFECIDTASTYYPHCCTWHNSRLWIGNLLESGSTYYHRLRWSSATDYTSFNSGDYIDLIESSGKVLKMLSLGRNLVVYKTDGVFVGRPTNYADLPFAFEKIETGGRGLVGIKAVVSWLNGHFFVTQDDIYYLDTNGIATPLESPIFLEAMQNCSYPENIYVTADPNNERIIFGFPQSTQNINKVYSFFYKIKAWTQEDLNASVIANPLLDLGITWDTVTNFISDSTWGAMGEFGAWSNIKGDTARRDLYHVNGGYFYTLSSESNTDDNYVGGSATTDPIQATITTGDIDLNMPDYDKTFTRLGIKLDRRPSASLTYTVQSSDDLGYTWKDLGNITIGTNSVEGKVNFRVTGSNVRFRLRSSSEVNIYNIIEITIRLKERGLESQYD